MKVKDVLRPVDLAREAGVSVQTVRDYERMGFLPPAERSPQGYRRYGQQHLHAMRAARVMIGGFGWEHALHIMQHIHRRDLTATFTVIDARHAFIHQRRLEVEAMLKALQSISASLLPSSRTQGKAKMLLIGEVAKRAGVRVSAIRFWEGQGFVHPARDTSSRYRLYDERQVYLIQIVTLLRKAGYTIEATRAVLAQLASGTPGQALQAAEGRLKELDAASRRCAEATAAAWEYIVKIAVDGHAGLTTAMANPSV